MDLQLTLTGRTDLTSQLYRQLRDAVLEGRLRDGERLPATRELARDLAVSRNTVAGAYDRLTAEGFLAARVGAGTFVRAGASRPRSRRSAPAGVIMPRPVWQELVTATTSEAATPAYDFRIGIPDGRLFPVQTWRRLLNRQLRTSMLTDARYRAPGGHPELRAAIARHVGVSRSVRAAADDVLVTRGAQQAIDLIARALVEWAARHRSAVIEDDYDTEFRYTPRPLEPLQTLDRHGRVIYVGTFAKTMLPLIRTGFLVAPASLRPALLTARQLTDWHGDRPTDAGIGLQALSDFSVEGAAPGLVLGFGAIPAERIEAGVRRLAELI